MIPRQWTGSNYTELFVGGENVNTTANILKMFQNSFVVSGVVTVFTVFITSLAAFAYERLDFKGGDKIFWTLMYVKHVSERRRDSAAVPHRQRAGLGQQPERADLALHSPAYSISS